MTQKTYDRAKTHDRNVFYLADKIGEKRSTTPEGFLVCHDVPIARTGTQMYAADEVPIEPGPDGLVRVDRAAEDVFRPETLASFEGKPVTVEHPNDFVTPDNWQQLAVGFVQNVRRGEGINDDLIIADLVITDQAAIRYVNEQLPEVSAGYTAEYVQTEPGRGAQRDIVGNHVALVERGRAGPRCSIQDHEGKPDDMKTKDAKPSPQGKQGFIARLKAFLDSEMPKEEAEEEKAKDSMEEGEKPEAKDEAGDINARLDRIEAVLAKLVPMEEKEHGTQLDEGMGYGEEKKAEDDGELTSAEPTSSQPEAVGMVLSGDSLKLLTARAEILAPGTASGKTFDAKKAERAEVESVMRATLVKAYGTPDGKECINPLLAGRDLQKLTGDSLASVFIGAAELMRVKNNRRVAGNAPHAAVRDFGRATTPASINAAAREFWAKRATH